MTRLDVSVHEPEFLPVEAQILCALLDKHEHYVLQGRLLEAKGVERAIRITWDTLKGNFDDTQPSAWAHFEG
jgi:hypothetical protein